MEASSLKRLFLKDYPNVFAAFEGELHGTHLKYDTGKAGKDDITSWSHSEDWVSWHFRASEAGEFRVEITYAAESRSAGGSFTVSVANQQLSADVEPTGGAYEFQSFELGTIRIAVPGEYSLTCKPDRILGEALMNLKEVRFEAIPQGAQL